MKFAVKNEVFLKECRDIEVKIYHISRLELIMEVRKLIFTFTSTKFILQNFFYKF